MTRMFREDPQPTWQTCWAAIKMQMALEELGLEREVGPKAGLWSAEDVGQRSQISRPAFKLLGPSASVK